MFSTFIYFSIKVDTFFETILFCSLSFRTLIPLVILPVCVLGMSFCGDLAFSSFVFSIFLSLFCCDELNVLFCSDEVASLRLLLKFSFLFSNLLFFSGFQSWCVAWLVCFFFSVLPLVICEVCLVFFLWFQTWSLVCPLIGICQVALKTWSIAFSLSS